VGGGWRSDDSYVMSVISLYVAVAFVLLEKNIGCDAGT
jgi:hypothetical protein